MVHSTRIESARLWQGAHISSDVHYYFSAVSIWTGKTNNALAATHLLLVMLFPTVALWSQPQYINYTTKDGLPTNQIYGFHQDHDGVIWMASDRGLIRFNGRDFETYDSQNGLPSSIVLKLFPQANGQIWCATSSNELFFFHPDTLSFHTYKYNSVLKAIDGEQIRGLEVADKAIRFRYIYSFGYVKIDSTGKVFKHSFENRLMLWPRNNARYVEHEGYHFLSLDSSLQSKYAPFHWVSRDLFIEREDVVVRSDLKAISFFYPDKSVKTVAFPEMRDAAIQDIGISDQGIWAATKMDGVFLLSFDGEQVEHYLPETDATHFFVDRQGGRWVSTLANGIYYSPNRYVSFLEPTRNHTISSVSVGKDGRLVVGTLDHLFFQFDVDNNLLRVDTTIFEARHRYFPFDDLAIENLHDRGFKTKAIVNISDRIDTVGLYCNMNRVYDSRANQMYQSEHRVFDAEFLGNGLLCAERNRLNHIRDDSIQASYTFDENVLDIDVDDAHIYCSTEGDGLHVLDHHFALKYVLDEESGLSSNFINSVTLDADTLWICTRSGLAKSFVKVGERVVEGINQNLGLAAKDVNAVLIRDDIIYAGTAAGLNYFRKADWHQWIDFELASQIRVTRILVGDRANDLAAALSYDQNRIQVDFELVQFPTLSPPLFEYRLHGLETNWNTTSHNAIIYHSLPPNQYTLEVRLADADLTTHQSLQLPFQIDIPYYQRWWFVLAVTGLVVFVVYLFFKYKVLRYNPVVMQGILSNINARLKPQSNAFVVRSNGKDVKLYSEKVHCVEANGNYIQIHVGEQKVIVRERLSAFTALVPDPENYLQLRRSLIVRLDKIQAKGKDSVTLMGQEFKVGNTFLPFLRQIDL